MQGTNIEAPITILSQSIITRTPSGFRSSSLITPLLTVPLAVNSFRILWVFYIKLHHKDALLRKSHVGAFT